MNNLEEIVNPLLHWYQANKKILPWRVEKDPYKIWISEIMLQQTRIEAVKDYYKSFMKVLPSVHDLANIDEEKLLKLWQGLGYYNRARNLKKAAQIIEEKYNGNLPNTYKELLTLPGIGEYTAGAIASIAYDEKVTAVDGNVLRVISRIIGSKKNILENETKKEIIQLLQDIIPDEAGNFNEALMELGEVICLPNQEPLCSKCPLKKKCYAHQNNLTREIPIREKQIKRAIEEKTIFILLTNQGEIALQKRAKTGLLAGMYEFPNIDGIFKEEEIFKIFQEQKLAIEEIENLGDFKHIFTHKVWKMKAYKVNVQKKNKQFNWVLVDELNNTYPIPTAFYKIYEKVKK